MKTKIETAQEEVARYETLGLAIAELLHLRRSRSDGRYNTNYGNKSAEGLGRTVARLVHEELEA